MEGEIIDTRVGMYIIANTVTPAKEIRRVITTANAVEEITCTAGNADLTDSIRGDEIITIVTRATMNRERTMTIRATNEPPNQMTDSNNKNSIRHILILRETTRETTGTRNRDHCAT